MFYPVKHFKLIFIILFFIVFITTGSAQEALRPRSALSAGGSSGIINVNGRQYYLQQSIGQQSITGISNKQDYLLRQGFIQPIYGYYSQTVQEKLPVVVHPNPFSSHMNINFPEAPAGNLYVTIYDLSGKIVFFQKYEASGVLTLDLSSLSSSVYIIRVNTTTKYFYSRIIKL